MSEAHARVAIVTVSDRAYFGEREDETGPLLANVLHSARFTVSAATVIPDEEEMIVSTLLELVRLHTPLIVTTGGTGLGARDVTPEATRAVITREAPGLSEEMRRVGLSETRHAILSRGVCGIREQTLIVNLPGNPQGAVQSLESILDVLPHALRVLLLPSFDHTKA